MAGFAISLYGWNRIDLFADAWKAAGFRMVGHIVFRKSYSPSSRFFRYEHESAYLLGKGNVTPPAKPIPGVLDMPYSGNKLHPTQKPVAALLPLVETFCSMDGLVLDPFAGSDLSLVAAQHLGRNWLGMELDPEHADTATRRLASTGQGGRRRKPPTSFFTLTGRPENRAGPSGPPVGTRCAREVADDVHAQNAGNSASRATIRVLKIGHAHITGHRKMESLDCRCGKFIKQHIMHADNRIGWFVKKWQRCGPGKEFALQRRYRDVSGLCLLVKSSRAHITERLLARMKLVFVLMSTPSKTRTIPFWCALLMPAAGWRFHGRI
ncbi:hypothetical protein AA0313_2320 [Acetobacter indonesiensis NRIC 0313]|uniref:Methyltransferase n=1 Tax=Acetobacter indonesiensis TaxID=104101 RepID=A0A6N3T5H6_9PROT|nr:DNA methyltransferase [Acetobacter indonesiensis]GAN64021.1 DNA methylase N-4/N-6 domain-containing protein [Acetobacter indonesiensis]GBQ60153.1 hypothetical protein AA0313_2320 [Acetobacter indonesiensis NRIC 0313]GEN02837.1 hypothetical protein AIN02nite_08620 [Acetobacter indonesiensis]